MEMFAYYYSDAKAFSTKLTKMEKAYFLRLSIFFFAAASGAAKCGNGCQKALSWTLDDAVTEIIKMRKELDDGTTERKELRQQLETTSKNLEATQQELQVTREELQTINNRVVPVGSIYIEYYNQSNPVALWPRLKWQDISDDYAGLFFRTSGDGSEGWGTIQMECAPGISAVLYTATHQKLDDIVDLPKTGWSVGVYTGQLGSSEYNEGLKFYKDECEVRPRNQAIRIWKRIA